jgi:nucleoside-diphosphate-sugar epimerase
VASLSDGAGRVLVTGASGFTGRYLIEALRAVGYEVLDPALSGFDLRKPDELLQAVSSAQFEYVIHLAAISFVASDDAAAFYAVNTVGTSNLLDALARTGWPLRKVIVASSANVYGNANADAIHEFTPPAPVNHYACSKLAMEHIVHTYTDRLPVIITRPFNYTGPGQASHFLVPKLVRHFALRATKIKLGNVDVVRDFLDVRAVAQSYVRLLTSGAVGETYNVCSGVGRSLRWVLDTLSELAGCAAEIEVDPGFVRAAEVRRLVGDGRRLRAAIGDTGYADFRDTLAWMLSSASVEQD